ncbi:histidine acid phosphatase family protein [Dictyostelium discoideum AX4]|uniref:Probable acid phosphatase DDB_G0284755 n=1 Tax=Dictyostelium discoideum TaxID=44689 RepID=Y4755_DICDI|nr:histidine acid phosphatase family protein [Dictyostelium discoideum AX4]Q54P71.2 RecName: Full=Probable acid phosphatase DDB_G0284755 [Dictyostelium discoideum]EAL65030.2 histidine acid phosphatase family protein [Dictyostelium discoideum AX4]|eukprot:XP_638387.2 histidine acid phosphatase family protein [Dictyostelium discoideum AX4]
MIINFLLNSIVGTVKLDENPNINLKNNINNNDNNKENSIEINDYLQTLVKEEDFKNQHTDPNFKFLALRSTKVPIDEYNPENYQLKFVQIITRHGRRTPESKRYPLTMWTCNSLDQLITNKDTSRPDCNMGQLTVLGIVDQINVGKAYRNLFINNLHFLDNKYNKDQIFIRSSNRERTISSARSFMHGLYGGSFADDQEKSPNHSSFLILDEKDENMYPRSSPKYNFLKGLLKKHKAVIEENEKSNLKEFTEKIKNIFEDSKFDTAFYVPSWRSYAGLVNSFDCFRNNGLPLPKGFTNDVIQRMYEESAKEFKSARLFPEMSILGIGRFVNDLTKQMYLKSVNDPSVKDLKLSLYSGHDTTLAALLVAYDMYEDNVHPVTSSALEYLLFQDKNYKEPEVVTKSNEKELINHQYVKVIFNHKPIHIGPCKDKEVDGMCPLSEFLKISQSIIPTNYDEQSKITDEEKNKYIQEST